MILKNVEFEIKLNVSHQSEVIVLFFPQGHETPWTQCPSSTGQIKLRWCPNFIKSWADMIRVGEQLASRHVADDPIKSLFHAAGNPSVQRDKQDKIVTKQAEAGIWFWLWTNGPILWLFTDISSPHPVWLKRSERVIIGHWKPFLETTKTGIIKPTSCENRVTHCVVTDAVRLNTWMYLHLFGQVREKFHHWVIWNDHDDECLKWNLPVSRTCPPAFPD